MGDILASEFGAVGFRCVVSITRGDGKVTVESVWYSFLAGSNLRLILTF